MYRKCGSTACIKMEILFPLLSAGSTIIHNDILSLLTIGEREGHVPTPKNGLIIPPNLDSAYLTFHSPLQLTSLVPTVLYCGKILGHDVCLAPVSFCCKFLKGVTLKMSHPISNSRVTFNYTFNTSRPQLHSKTSALYTPLHALALNPHRQSSRFVEMGARCLLDCMRP